MKLTLLLSLFLFQLGFSQQKSCGTDVYLEQMMSDPVAKQKHLDLQNRFEIELSKLQDQQNKSATNTNATIIIPVAVHFPNVAANSPDKACLIQLAQNQIDILNVDFNATNADLALWTQQVQAFYPGTNVGNFNVQFVLATKNHPAGTGLTNGQKAITFATNFLNGTIRDLQWKGYLNIVCKDLGGNNVGSYTGGSPIDGAPVFITNIAIGSGNGCTGYVPYVVANRGRTLVHELGHYLSLHHNFGKVEGGNVCLPSNTDEVDDTPQCVGSGGCPAPGSVPGCIAGQKSLTMNYMDYVIDDCMYMFTAGQVTRMRAYFNTIASEFATNVLSDQEFKFKDFSLYPNPNNGSFKISFEPETNDKIEIIVLDISGRNIHNKTFQNFGMFEQELQLNAISSGIYFINIQNGENKMVKRIVVE